MTRGLNQREEKLSAALRDLGSCSRQSASPELSVTLKDAFRRHHARRRRMIRLRIALVCFCVVGLTGLILLKSKPLSPTQTNAVHMIPPQQVSPPVEINVTSAKQPEPLKRPVPRRQPSIAASGFWKLPSSDLIPSSDQLRVVRMEMRAGDLRLLGAPVSDVVARNRVTADFVVGHDGTPYAVRLVQVNF